MTELLLIAAAVIALCVVLNKISGKLGIPMLLGFIVLGMLFGSDGIIKIPYDNYATSEAVCSIAMIFIMFYGGFGTKWSAAKPVAANALILSSLGTVLTAGLVGIFCHFALKIPMLESFLIGAVISSTDAASVFSILRSKKLGLKNGTASLLEVESGSNDPFSYMLTVIMLSLMNGSVSGASVVYMLFAQIVYGAVAGVAIAILTLFILKRVKLPSGGFEAIFIVAVAVAAYALPTYFGGNGFLSTYITGIILGNHRMPNKQSMVSFFDGITGLMQMLLFFLLGLLSFPSQLPSVALIGLAVALFLTFVARPASVFAIMTPFKCSVRQKLLVSFAGMRGAASIVFAIMAVVDPSSTDNDIFHMVFFIVLFSILFQGTLLAPFARKLGMIDEGADVMKTFTDYADEVPVQFMRFTLKGPHKWVGRTISNITLPPDSILALLLRNGKKIVPNGSTVLHDGDTMILSGKAAEDTEGAEMFEKVIEEGDEEVGKKISELSYDGLLIVIIKRGEEVVIPRGNTVLHIGDILVMMSVDDAKTKEITEDASEN